MSPILHLSTPAANAAPASFAHRRIDVLRPVRATPPRIPESGGRPCAGPPIEPNEEVEHWRRMHVHQRFATASYGFADFEPAYRCGVEQYLREPFRSFSRCEPGLEARWPSLRGASELPWRIARFAARMAWERAQQRAYAIAREG